MVSCNLGWTIADLALVFWGALTQHALCRTLSACSMVKRASTSDASSKRAAKRQEKLATTQNTDMTLQSEVMMDQLVEPLKK